MRIEIVIFAALAALASAAPQWPYRDAVAPYYYGYPGKSPYMYRSGDEDDEMDEHYGRQDLKVATSDGGSTVTVVEDDEKADGVRVVETGSAKPLKPVVQSANNNNQQQQQDQQQPAAAQAQQPLSTANNPNNAQQSQTPANGQPLTVQQSGQQPPAFPPARPASRPPRPAEDEDEEEEDDESEEDDEDAEDEEEDGDSDEDEEEDEEDRRRDAIAQKEAAGSSEEPQPVVVQEEEQQAIPNSEGSDEVVQEEQPAPVVVEKPVKIPSQSQVLSNKVNKNKQNAAHAASVPVVPGKPKKKPVVTQKVKPNSGAIEALVPGYVTDQGEVLVPVDTVTGSQPITIVPDPFSPPSRIVAGPRPIPRGSVPNTPSRQVPYWYYRSSPAINPLTEGISPMSRETLYTAVPPPGSIFTFDDDDDDDDADDSPSIIPGNRLRQDADDDDDEADEDEEEEDRKKAAQKPPQKVPLAAVPAVGNSGEDDEAEALAFINSGRPPPNKKPASAPQSASGGNKKPGAGGGKPTGQAGSNESDSEEDIEESQEDEEDDDVSNEDEEEDDDSAAARAAGASPAQIAANPMSRGRMYVDEDYVSFPPSRSPTIFAVIQGKYPGGPGGPVSHRRQQPQYVSVPNPGNPYQRFVVRVTPNNKQPRPPTSSSLFYRPLESRPPPNRRVVPVASFDVSVEDTRPSSSSFAVDSDEDSESVSIGGGPSPGPSYGSYPFVYKVQGSVQGLRLPSGGGSQQQSLQSLAALLGRPGRPSLGYYGATFSSGGPGGPRPSGPRPSGPGPYGYRPRPPPYSVYSSPYGPGGPPPSSLSFGPSRPGPGGPSRGPPIIVRRKQPGGRPNRPPKPHLIAVYNPGGSSGPGPRPREPVDEEYYTYEVPEHNTKIVPGGGPPKNKRPTVHRKPTPVIHQKLVSEDEEPSDELETSPGPRPQQVQIIPHGTVRSRRIRGGKQLKPKKNSKKTSSSTKKQQQQDQQDPLGLLSKINKSKTKMH